MARTQASGTVQRAQQRPARGLRLRLDLATILGLGSAFGLIIIALVLDGTPQSFLDIRSLLIVLGGTFGVTMVCFPLRETLGVHKVVLKAVRRSNADPSAEAIRMLRLADEARREGVLAINARLQEMADQPYLRRAMAMVVDGFPSEEVERVMGRQIDETVGRHYRSAGVLRKAAEVSPAMGLIGTLIGLVQMLGNLDDPTTIGPSMAIALLTTFYGAVLANMVFAPLAAKLERNSEDESLVMQIHLLGTMSIGHKENPRRLEMLLNTLLPPSMRVRYFD